MSRLIYGIKPALFDMFTQDADSSLQKEIERILVSRNLSKELEGLCSDFGIPLFEGATKEHMEKVEYTIAYYIMKFETRLEKTTVKIREIKNGQLVTHIELYPKLDLMPVSMHMTIQM